MTTNQLFFSLAGLIVTLSGMTIAFIKYYLDAKIGESKTYTDGKLESLETKFDGKFDTINTKLDSLAKSVDLLVHYMIEHQGKIATLEERTKKL